MTKRLKPMDEIIYKGICSVCGVEYIKGKLEQGKRGDRYLFEKVTMSICPDCHEIRKIMLRIQNHDYLRAKVGRGRGRSKSSH